MDGSLEQRIEARLAAWLEAVETEGATDIVAFCADDPELVPHLQALLEGEEALHEMIAGAAPSGDPRDHEVLAGRYLLAHRLGAGGSGEVYLARDLKLERDVAIKVLSRGRFAGTGARRRFEREARILALLDHENVVPIHDVGSDGEQLFISMKYVEGGTLLGRSLPLAPREAARLALGVAEALAVAHAHGIVHRDVKPANVLLDEGRPLLADFGLARADDGATETREGSFAGTLAYTSPEQFQGATRALDARSDVYALGATLYHLLSGHPPFEEHDSTRLMMRVLTERPQPLGLSGEDRDLEVIVLRCLEKDREDRFADGTALAADLRAYLDGKTIASRPIGIWGRTIRLIRRHPRRTAASVILLVVVMTLAAFAWTNHVRDRRGFEAARSLALSQLTTGRLGAARETLRSMPAAWAERPEGIEIARRLRARESEEALYNLIQRRRNAIEARKLRGAIKEVEAAGASLSERSRLLVAIARLQLGDPGASRGITGLEGPIPEAIRAECEGGGALRILRPAEFDSADECVLAAIVLGSSRPGSFALRRSLVERALAIDDGDVRARIQQAMLAASEGEWKVAYVIVRDLDRDLVDRRFRNLELARLLSRLGEFDRADRILEGIPLEERDLEVEAERINLILERGDPAPARAALAQVEEFADRHPALVSARVAVAMFDRDWPTLDALDRSIPDRDLLPRDRWNIEIQITIARCYEYELKVEEASSELTRRLGELEYSPLSPSVVARESEAARALTRTKLAELRVRFTEERTRGVRLLETAEGPIESSQASLAIARIETDLGDHEAAHVALANAYELDPSDFGIRAAVVRAAMFRAENKDFPQSLVEAWGSRDILIATGKRLGDRIVRLGKRSVPEAEYDEWDQIVLCRGALAYRSNDLATLVRMRELFSDQAVENDAKRANLEVFDQMVDRLEKGLKAP
ncbi:MAG: protein kinase [Planctomycetota bacterium]